jgi:hypothetical protein
MMSIFKKGKQAYEIQRLRSEVAALELTGDRAELQSLLDQCGLDFERMRERALKAEASLAKADEALLAVVNGHGRDFGLTPQVRGLCYHALYVGREKPQL